MAILAIKYQNKILLLLSL